MPAFILLACWPQSQGNRGALNRLSGMRGVTVLRADRVTISAADERRAYVQIDGEIGGTLPAEIRIVPDAITLLVAAGYEE